MTTPTLRPSPPATAVPLAPIMVVLEVLPPYTDRLPATVPSIKALLVPSPRLTVALPATTRPVPRMATSSDEPS